MPQVTVDFPSGYLKDSHVNSSAAIAYTKLVAASSIDVELAGPTTAITALDKLLHIVRGATATLIGVEVAIVTVADDASRTATIDIHKSTGGGSFATIMTSTCNISTSTTVRTPVAGVIASPTLVDGDILKAVVTVAGGGGTVNAKGLILTLTIAETPS